YLKDRSNHPVYQQYVDRYYCEIANQLKGLLYKDGGPVIGIQLENEYWRGQQGESHILWLKQTARKHGLDVPMYTITGWRAASVPKDEVIPLWGGYPAEPWTTHIKKIKTNSNFSFQLPMNDESIGNDLVKPYGNYLVDYTRYPYFTCELGIGNQISEHRRPIIGPLDGLAIAIIKTGSGSNLLGYYVFTGGTNPTGVYTTLEENKEETGYWNEYPDISYDFQAAIRETGELAPSYYQIKKLHYFLNEFGSDLAPMLPVLPDDLDAKKALQYAIRAKNNSAFVFGLNYYRGIQKAEQKDVQFDIKLAEENIIFPSQAVNIPDSTIFIWPINFNMDDVLLKYATAQPLCMLASKDATDWYFIQNHGVQPEFAFAVSGIEEIEANKGNVRKYPNQYIISNLEPGINCFIKIKTTDGRQLRVTVLSYEESNKIWLFREKDKKLLFLSNSNLYLQNNKLHIFGESPDRSLISFNNEFKINASGKELKKELRDTYVKFHIQVPAKDINVLIEKRPIFENASWLKTSVDEVEENNKLFNKLFIKEFSIGNPSPIKSSKLYLMSETACRIKANNKWINQMVNPNIVNNIDLTGYLKKGENQLMFAFPFVDGNKAFVAKIELDYFNSDQLEIFTDRTWLTAESYTLPAPWSLISNLNEPEIVTGKKVKSNTL
ncbi:MAG: beta-galactosidase, partial [Calditrichaceae bacterium]